MLDDPDQCYPSKLMVKVADGNISSVESEGRFGEKQALVMRQFDSILLPTDAVTDHSTIIIFDTDMYVVPIHRVQYLRKKLAGLALKSNTTNTYRLINTYQI